MKATVDGVTYEGTEDEMRRVVENPPDEKIRKKPLDPEYGVVVEYGAKS